VAKHPDVWGQARLTKHRDEFEQQMFGELGNFKDTLQGTVSGSDQAYFTDAFALSAAASGGSTGVLASPGSKPGSSTTDGTVAGTAQKGKGVSVSIANTTPAPASQSSSQQSQSSAASAPALPDQSDAFSAFNNISRTGVRQPLALEFAAGKGGIALEPTILLEEKARYLNCLHELRRINEGDDTADSPGYSLNLVRIPVSLLPGKCTEIGHGAEITMTLTPYLSDELLPTTFRNLVENDVVDEITFPVTRFINDQNNRVYFEPSTRAADLDQLAAYVDSHSIEEMISDVANHELFDDELRPEKKPSLATYRWKPSLEDIFSRPEWAWVDEVLRAADDQEESWKAACLESLRSYLEWLRYWCYKIRNGEGSEVVQFALAGLRFQAQERQTVPLPEGSVPARPKAQAGAKDDPNAGSGKQKSPVQPPQVQLPEDIAAAKSTESAALINTGHAAAPGTKSRSAQLPFPRSQLIDIYGTDFTRCLGKDAYLAFAREQTSKPCPDSGQLWIHLPDVKGYFQEETAAAYKFLSNPSNADLWRYCSADLATAIRAHNLPYV
jgi:hypothetical protein